jgi:hypothetical protein
VRCGALVASSLPRKSDLAAKWRRAEFDLLHF